MPAPVLDHQCSFCHRHGCCRRYPANTPSEIVEAIAAFSGATPEEVIKLMVAPTCVVGQSYWRMMTGYSWDLIQLAVQEVEELERRFALPTKSVVHPVIDALLRVWAGEGKR